MAFVHALQGRGDVAQLVGVALLFAAAHFVAAELFALFAGVVHGFAPGGVEILRTIGLYQLQFGAQLLGALLQQFASG